MGVDARLYISKQWGVKDIIDVIQDRYGVKPQAGFHDWAPDYITLTFQLKGGEYARMLHVHTDSEVGGLPCIGLGLRSNEEGIEILKTLAKTFGGILQEADCDDGMVEYQKPGQGNADFVLKEAIKHNPELGEGGKPLAEYIACEKWRERYDSKRSD